MKTPSLEDSLRSGLERLRRPDGGFPTSVGAHSELEPTAVASLALDDDPIARRWLVARLRHDGALFELDGRPAGPAAGALVALALASDPSDARSALAFALSGRGLPPPDVPQDRRAGWGWTRDTRSLVEPTARVLLALKHLTPTDRDARTEAVGLLAERRCADGGWNYGNRSHLDIDLLSYAQTTAIALMALRGEPQSLVGPPIAFLRRSWRKEPGILTTAQAAVAFRLHGLQGDANAAMGSLETYSQRRGFFARPIDVGWAALATGPSALLAPFGGAA